MGGEMLTFLSRSFRWIQDHAAAPEPSCALVQASPGSQQKAGATLVFPVRPEPARLRLVQGAGDRDSSVATRTVERPLERAGAAAFVAGQGARLYSLEVFRRERRTAPSPLGAA